MNEIIILLIIGLVSGYLSGLIGIGGGIVIVPPGLLCGHEPENGPGHHLFMFMIPVGILGVYTYYKAGNVD